MKKTLNFIKENKVEIILLGIILIVALSLRLYRIADFMTYLGDEGRDMRVVRDLITQGNLVFIGPQTSVGNMYLGPLYYYMIAPALFLSGLNPVGPAIFNAILGTVTVLLCWFVTRDWFGRLAGSVTALFYAISPVTIFYSRTSWNPNPMPFFALLTIFGLYQIWIHKKLFWLPIIGFTFAAALQMHYLGLLLTPTILLFWLLSLAASKANTSKILSFIKFSALGLLIFLITMSPLLLFDIKHDWLNAKAFMSLVFGGEGSISSLKFFQSVQSNLNLIVRDLFFGRTFVQNSLILTAPVLISLWFFLMNFHKTQVKLIFVWLLVAVVGLGLYKHDIYIHYLGFIYPAVFILLGALISYFFFLNKRFGAVVVITTLVLVYLSIANSPVRSEPNRILARTQTVVDLIMEQSRNKPFNFGLIAKNNYDESYRYFFENKNSLMVRGEDKITDQLFVVCEDGEACQPEGNSQYQVAIFGIANVVEQWQVDYVKIYKLVHTK